MEQKYKDWIQNYERNIFRKCIEVTQEMQYAFPELRIAKGMVTIIDDGRDYPHQWLVDIEGNIVDPTAKQWVAIINYKEIKEEDEQLVGKCPNCGEWIYGDYRKFCDDKCVDSYLRYIMSGI
jgi:hypothetical protein